MPPCSCATWSYCDGAEIHELTADAQGDPKICGTKPPIEVPRVDVAQRPVMIPTFQGLCSFYALDWPDHDLKRTQLGVLGIRGSSLICLYPFLSLPDTLKLLWCLYIQSETEMSNVMTL